MLSEAYDLVKTAFRFRLRLQRERSAYDLVKTRLSESEEEVEELNQTQSVTIWFSLDHKRNRNAVFTRL